MVERLPASSGVIWEVAGWAFALLDNSKPPKGYGPKPDNSALG